MTTVGIRELKERAILTTEETDSWLHEMDEIGAEISHEWQGGSAVEAIREGRRE